MTTETPAAKLVAFARRSGAFLVVGAVGFLVDAGTYNLLVFAGGRGPLADSPLVAKLLAIGTATVVTYVGNRWWTYADRPAGNSLRRYLAYAICNLIAIGLQLGCLGFSRYVLDLSSPLADNLAGTVIGQVVAVVFRYWAYGRYVFTAGADSADR